MRVRGPPTPIVMVTVRIAHPFGHRRGPIPLGWHQHAREERGAPSAPPNNARKWHRQLTCALWSAHESANKKKARALHEPKNEHLIKRAPPSPKINLRNNASDSMFVYQHASRKIHMTALPSRYTWHQMRIFHLRKSSSITTPLIRSESPRVQGKTHMRLTRRATHDHNFTDQRNSPKHDHGVRITCGNFAKQFVTSITQLHLFKARHTSWRVSHDVRVLLLSAGERWCVCFVSACQARCVGVR